MGRSGASWEMYALRQVIQKSNDAAYSFILGEIFLLCIQQFTTSRFVSRSKPKRVSAESERYVRVSFKIVCSFPEPGHAVYY